MKNIKEIKQKFSELQSKEDFVALLNYVRLIVFGNNEFIFTEPQVNYYINSEPIERLPNNILRFESLKELGVKTYGGRYKSFDIKKKTGGQRTIHAPNRGLKAIQKCLNYILQAIYNEEVHTAANGFVLGKSIVDNANMHVRKNYVYNIDLKDFFPSIDKRRVYLKLLESPFNLSEEPRSKIANMIAVLCCHEFEVERTMDGKTIMIKERVLPQGAPTSPILSNIVCKKLDLRLARAARNHGVNYTRYADDITFSSMHNVYQKDSQFLQKVKQIIVEQHFEIKESKTRLQKQGDKQEVTGLIVNDKVNVSQKYIKELRHWLYVWSKYGESQAESYFTVQYLRDKGHIKVGKPTMKNVIYGKLQFLKMVKGNNNSTYNALNDRFLILTDGKKSNELTKKEPFEIIITKTSSVKIKDKPKSNTAMVTYLKPSGMVKFLTKYNQDPILRSTCHDIDSNEIEIINEYCKTKIYDFSKHLEKIIVAFKEIENDQFCPPYIKSLIRVYLTGKDFDGNVVETGWSSDNIKINWSDKTLSLWAQKNQGLPLSPNEGLADKNENIGFEISRFNSTVLGKPIQTFRDLVIHFKHLFHIRRDNSLRDLIEQKNINEEWEDKIDFIITNDNFPKNIELFVDVDKLIQTYNSLIQLIVENHSSEISVKPKVKLSFYEHKKRVYFSIHHLNSKYGKTLASTEIRPLGKTYSGIIKKLINGNCNFHLKADFGQNEYAMFRLWYDKSSKKLKVEKIDTFEGVEHILEFYK